MNTHKGSSIAKRRNLILLGIVLALPYFLAWGTAPGTAQSTKKEERAVEDRIPKHLPIKIKLKKPEKVKDLDNDNWLADLEIEVTNTGIKPIYFLSFFMRFLDVKRDSGAGIVYEFNYGRSKLVEIDQLATPDDVPIEPGATYVFTLHEDYVKGWDWYRTHVEQKPQPKKVAFVFSTLSFGDGTGYVTNGGVFVPQPPKPRSSYEKVLGSGWATTIAAGCRPSRPPNSTLKQKP